MSWDVSLNKSLYMPSALFGCSVDTLVFVIDRLQVHIDAINPK
jgi:hypothetical protein